MPALSSEQARRVYDRIGPAQDWQRFYEDAATADLVAHARFDTSHMVVELGCGTGRFGAALLARHLPVDAAYVGVDLSPRMVALASDRMRPWRARATVSLIDGEATIPVADGAADRFVANYVFDLLGPEETRGIAKFVSRAWTGVWTRRPALVGGCRPVRLVDALDPSAWDVRHRGTVVAWGIASEIVIAARR